MTILSIKVSLSRGYSWELMSGIPIMVKAEVTIVKDLNSRNIVENTIPGRLSIWTLGVIVTIGETYLLVLLIKQFLQWEFCHSFLMIYAVMHIQRLQLLCAHQVALVLVYNMPIQSPILLVTRLSLKTSSLTALGNWLHPLHGLIKLLDFLAEVPKARGSYGVTASEATTNSRRFRSSEQRLGIHGEARSTQFKFSPLMSRLL